MRGSCLPHAQFSLEYLKFSLRYTKGNMFGMFSFALLVFRAFKCAAVNFITFKSAGVPFRLLEYLDAPILIIACAPCMRTRDMHAHRDITRFTDDANHITMMSPAFVFHSYHVRRSWHHIIGVLIIHVIMVRIAWG